MKRKLINLALAVANMPTRGLGDAELKVVTDAVALAKTIRADHEEKCGQCGVSSRDMDIVSGELGSATWICIACLTRRMDHARVPRHIGQLIAWFLREMADGIESEPRIKQSPFRAGTDVCDDDCDCDEDDD